jgi:hypothetical protein
MRLGFRCGVDAGMKMEQMHVDRRGKRAGACIPANHAVMGGRPDRHAASVPPAVLARRNGMMPPTITR